MGSRTLAAVSLLLATGFLATEPRLFAEDFASGVELEHGQSLILLDAQQSTNWCGYQLMGPAGGFKKVSGTWVVPTVAASSSDTASSTWTGVGGGCAESSCTVVEATLIQAGTEQDNSGGSPSYSAWWEAIPAPSIPASGGVLSSQNFDVSPGDQMTVTIDGSSLVVWTIQIVDRRGGLPHWTFNTTVPYAAAGLTAEWIEEAPLVFGTNGAGQIALSNFHKVSFSALTANGANPRLNSSEQIILTDGNGRVLASPSAPTATGDGFSVCYGSGPCS